jgi:peptidoglycan hydrolase CwlO-like protein
MMTTIFSSFMLRVLGAADPTTTTGAHMPHFDNGTLEVFLYSIAGLCLLIAGYRFGRLVSKRGHSRAIQAREQELFTAQKGFKNLYEQELANVRSENEQLKAKVEQMGAKVEEYRKKAAGLGGLFNSGGKKADAMYALLLENEALEEALYAQNEKLKQERTDSLKEQMRATGYRRVLMSQLLNDNRIKEYVAEILNDEKMLPRPQDVAPRAALPAATPEREDGHE